MKQGMKHQNAPYLSAVNAQKLRDIILETVSQTSYWHIRATVGHCIVTKCFS